MEAITLFIAVLASAWLVGVALDMGLYHSRRNRLDPYQMVCYLWDLVFSWAFVGWLTGELYAWTVREIRSQAKVATGGKTGETG